MTEKILLPPDATDEEIEEMVRRLKEETEDDDGSS